MDDSIYALAVFQVLAGLGAVMLDCRGQLHIRTMELRLERGQATQEVSSRIKTGLGVPDPSLQCFLVMGQVLVSGPVGEDDCHVNQPM